MAISPLQLVRLCKKLKLQKYNCKFKFNCTMYDAIFCGVRVMLFLVRRTWHEKWNVLME